MTILRKNRTGPETSGAARLMKSTETKLTAYGRWRRRTFVDNDVILTSVVVVGRRLSSFCDDDRHNAICRGYGAGIMAALVIIGDELYRSLAGERRSGRDPLWLDELRLRLFTTTISTTTTSSSSSSRNRLLSLSSSPAPASSSVIDSGTSTSRAPSPCVIRVH